MLATEIVWRTHHGDVAGVTVHAPDAENPDRVRLVIGRDFTLRLPPIESRLLAQALIDAADAAQPLTPRRVIPIRTAQPAALYHEPDQF